MVEPRAGPFIELRFLIPNKLGGTIIGAGGKNVKALRETYGSRINIGGSNGPERLMVVESDLKSMLAILSEIINNLQAQYVPNLRFEGDQSSNTETDIRMLVHQSLAGCIIGKGGERINKLRNESGLKTLKVYPQLCPESTDRIVQFVGSTDKIVDAINSIVDVCKETPVKDPKIPYDPVNFNSSIANEYGGWPGSTSGFQQNLSRKRVAQVAFGAESYDPVLQQHQQQQQQQHQHHQAAGGMDFSAFTNSMKPCGDYAGEPGQNAVMGGARQFRNPDAVEEMTSSMTIPSKMAGAIIGSQGIRVRQIRQTSGATVKISDGDGVNRQVTISGTSSQVNDAQAMVKHCLACQNYFA